MKTQLNFFKVFILFCLLFGISVSNAENYDIYRFNIDYSNVLLVPTAINDAGEIAGYFIDHGGPVYGFFGKVLSNKVDVTKFSHPEATFRFAKGTVATGMNSKGDIIGYYYDQNRLAHGFMRTKNDQYISFDMPNSTETVPTSINTSGTIVGRYYAKDGVHGFLRTPDGSFKPLRIYSTDDGLFPTSINDAGVVTGYSAANGCDHGFIYNPTGGGSNLYVAEKDGSLNNTRPVGINSRGDIVGYYWKHYPSGTPGPYTTYFHGFVRTSKGVITTFAVPGAKTDTKPTAINSNGTIVGLFNDNTVYGDHIFLRTPNGQITKLPNPGRWPPYATAINSKGIIAGYELIGKSDISYGNLLVLAPKK